MERDIQSSPPGRRLPEQIKNDRNLVKKLSVFFCRREDRRRFVCNSAAWGSRRALQKPRCAPQTRRAYSHRYDRIAPPETTSGTVERRSRRRSARNASGSKGTKEQGGMRDGTGDIQEDNSEVTGKELGRLDLIGGRASRAPFWGGETPPLQGEACSRVNKAAVARPRSAYNFCRVSLRPRRMGEGSPPMRATPHRALRRFW